MAACGKTAALCAFFVMGTGAVTYPEDNVMTRDRTEFFTNWSWPSLLDGQATNSMNHTDKVLHRRSWEPFGTTNWDYLYPFQWELDFWGRTTSSLCRDFWWMSYVVAVLYVAGIRWGEAAMKDRQAWDLKVPLNIWNLFLAVYSFFGALRCVPHLFMLLHEYGFDYTVCRAGSPMYGNGPTGFWVALFIYSKYFELIDTVFLVLRKRNVGFLHWYHHFSVLCYCWHAYIFEMPTGIYFASMNYTVHAIMYFYYFLAGIGKPPRWALLVTILQLAQMAAGIFVTVSHLKRVVTQEPANCDGYVPNLTFALGMYGSYFYLFGEFLVKRYCLKSRKGAGAAGKGKAAAGKSSQAAGEKQD